MHFHHATIEVTANKSALWSVHRGAAGPVIDHRPSGIHAPAARLGLERTDASATTG